MWHTEYLPMVRIFQHTHNPWCEKSTDTNRLILLTLEVIIIAYAASPGRPVGPLCARFPSVRQSH